MSDAFTCDAKHQPSTKAHVAPHSWLKTPGWTGKPGRYQCGRQNVQLYVNFSNYASFLACDHNIGLPKIYEIQQC